MTNTQVSRLRKAFTNNSSTNIKLSKFHQHKIEKSEGFLGRLLGPLSKTGLPLIGNVLKPLTKNFLIPLELMAAASATDTAINKKMFASGYSTLIVSNEEINDIMKIVKSLKEPGLLTKGDSETIQNEAKEQKGGFLSMLSETLGASFLGNLLVGKGKIRAGEGMIRAGESF